MTKPIRAGLGGAVVALVMLGAQAGPSAALADTSPVASFDQYATPADLPQHAGEPSIGVDWATGNVLFEASQNTLRVKFDDSTTPAAATWEDRTAPSSVFTADPILFTDPTLGRTFVSQLTILCSLASYSDNDGDTWTGPTQGCGVGLPEDHQTVGAGPYHQPAPLGAGILYPNAVYYCHQDGVLGFVLADGQAAYCALSITGSVTFANDVPIYTGLQCGGLHGHVKVGPDGTAYVPNQACDQVGFDPNLPGELYAHQAVVVSEDNGTSWQVRSVPDSKAVFYSDPQVAIGLNNTVYFAYQHGGEADGTGRHPRVAVSRDHGQTWAPSIDLGTSLGIENVEFPMVVAGDDGRAAVAFLGTTTPGDDQAADFNGVFDMYVSYTYDGGATWTTIDATPTDPVQRGCVQLVFATSHCPTRNLLDFNDVTIDQQGRVLVAYADGCIDACVTSTNPDDNGFDDQGVILRQSCGTGLFAAHDGELATCAAVTTPATPTTPAVATQPLPNTGAAMPLSLLALAAFGASAVLALTVVGRRARP